MSALRFDQGFHFDDPRLRFDGEAPEENPMPDNSFCYITRPSSNGASMTTMPKFRGTKTQAQIYTEVATKSGATEAVVAQVVKALAESIIDNTVACWKTDALGDGLIAFQCGCGGSSPIGEDPP